MNFLFRRSSSSAHCFQFIIVILTASRFDWFDHLFAHTFSPILIKRIHSLITSFNQSLNQSVSHIQILFIYLISSASLAIYYNYYLFAQIGLYTIRFHCVNQYNKKNKKRARFVIITWNVLIDLFVHHFRSSVFCCCVMCSLISRRVLWPVPANDDFLQSFFELFFFRFFFLPFCEIFIRFSFAACDGLADNLFVAMKSNK